MRGHPDTLLPRHQLSIALLCRAGVRAALARGRDHPVGTVTGVDRSPRSRDGLTVASGVAGLRASSQIRAVRRLRLW